MSPAERPGFVVRGAGAACKVLVRNTMAAMMPPVTVFALLEVVRASAIPVSSQTASEPEFWISGATSLHRGASRQALG